MCGGVTYFSSKYTWWKTLEHLIHVICGCETLDGIWEYVEGMLKDANIKKNILEGYYTRSNWNKYQRTSYEK